MIPYTRMVRSTVVALVLCQAGMFMAAPAEAQVRGGGGYVNYGGDSGYGLNAEVSVPGTGWVVRGDYLRHDIRAGTRERTRLGVGHYINFPGAGVRWLVAEGGWQGERFDVRRADGSTTTRSVNGYYVGTGVDAHLAGGLYTGAGLRYVNIDNRDGMIFRPYVGYRVGRTVNLFVAYEIADRSLERRNILTVGVGFGIGF